MSKDVEEAPWLPEYSQLASVEWLDRDYFTILNMRNFRYYRIGEPQYSWVKRDFKLSNLVSAELILSCWGSDMIAHIFLCFGFCDSSWIAISMETRRREDQPWSILRGFGRNYPVIYVVADEQDLIGVRSDIRREHVRLYPLMLAPATRLSTAHRTG